MINPQDELYQIRMLPIKQWACDSLVDWDYDNVKVVVERSLESMVYHIRLLVQAPTEALQQDRVIAEYPATWVQHIRKRLGWKHRTTQVKLSEYWVFPGIPVPKYAKDVKVALYSETVSRYGDD